MNITHGRAILAGLLLAGLAACAKAPPAVDVAKEAAAINAEDDAINAALKAHDADAAVKYDADDVQSWAPGAPAVKSKADDLAGTKAGFADPNYKFSFTPATTVVSSAGDIAYQTGTYDMTMTDPATKKPDEQTGNWVATWKKGDDGTWKLTAVASTQATPGAAAPASNSAG